MIAKREKAVALPTAHNNNQHNRDYHNLPRQSSNEIPQWLAEQISELLFFLLNLLLNQEERKQVWQLFESKLRQHLDIKLYVARRL